MSTVTVKVTVADGETKAKQKPSKFSVEHWRRAILHPFTIRDGKRLVSPNWMAVFCHIGHRESLSLETDQHEAAAHRARDLFLFLKANGWEQWRAKYRSAQDAPSSDVIVFTVTVRKAAEAEGQR